MVAVTIRSVGDHTFAGDSTVALVSVLVTRRSSQGSKPGVLDDQLGLEQRLGIVREWARRYGLRPRRGRPPLVDLRIEYHQSVMSSRILKPAALGVCRRPGPSITTRTRRTARVSLASGTTCSGMATLETRSKPCTGPRTTDSQVPATSGHPAQSPGRWAVSNVPVTAGGQHPVTGIQRSDIAIQHRAGAGSRTVTRWPITSSSPPPSTRRWPGNR